MDIVDLLKNSDKLKEALREAIWNNDRKLAKALIPLVKDLELTYLYAAKIIKGKIKDEWEDIIAQDEIYSFHYARNILKGRFEKGEEIISKSAEYSFYYARDVLKNRFEKGEEAISKSDEYSFRYAKNILKGRFKKGEDAISKSTKYSFYYAKDVLKNRFEKGEEAIINDKKILKEYMKFLKKRGKLDEFLKDHPEIKKEVK
jgi:mRNA-degrading endonuclease YafQ of YafQ-DinJ toxin-antitoxin module